MSLGKGLERGDHWGAGGHVQSALYPCMKNVSLKHSTMHKEYTSTAKKLNFKITSSSLYGAMLSVK